MIKCDNCGGQMRSVRESYRYDECGLNVTLTYLEVRRCSTCGEVEPVIPRIEELHASLARAVATKKPRLTGEEIRFLRKYIGFSSGDFANAIKVKPETISRWEHEKHPMNPTAEQALRVMALLCRPIDAYPVLELANLGQGDPAPIRVTARQKKNTWEANAA